MKTYIISIASISLFLLTLGTAQAATLESPIHNFSLWKATSRALILNWDSVLGATGYRIQILDTNGAPVKSVKIKAKITKKNISGLEPETSYTVSICAVIGGVCDMAATPILSAATRPAFLLADDYENETNAEVLRGAVKYVEGKEGKGFLKVYGMTPEGAELRANIVGYDNSDGQIVDPEIGTVEFWVKPTMDPANDTETHGLFTAWSGNGVNNWDISVYKKQLIVYRDYAPCVRSILKTAYTFEKNTWYKFSLTWRGSVTKLSINNSEVGLFMPEVRNVYARNGEQVFIGDDIFVTDRLRISPNSTISSKSLTSSDTDDVSCPGFVELLEQEPQEEYRGIKLHNFPSEATRNKAKEFIDLLPDVYEGEIDHMVIVADAQYNLGQTETALANFSASGRAMYLRESLFDTVEKWEQQAKTFFHEAGHGHIYAQGLNYGGPRGEPKGKEWGSISGFTAYVGECSSPQSFVLEDGFLTAYGSTMADEDLAEWVGVTFNMHRKGATFSALLDPQSKKYNAKYKKKIDFLLAKGFIDREIYAQVTKTTRNTTTYVEFND